MHRDNSILCLCNTISSNFPWVVWYGFNDAIGHIIHNACNPIYYKKIHDLTFNNIIIH